MRKLLIKELLFKADFTKFWSQIILPNLKNLEAIREDLDFEGLITEGPFETTNYIQHIDEHGLEMLEQVFSNHLGNDNEDKDGIDLGPITAEIYLRIVASLTPIFAVSPECSAASWTYFRNLMSSSEWAIPSIKNIVFASSMS